MSVMETDDHKPEGDVDANHWLPYADEAYVNAAGFLPTLLAGIREGAEKKDWNRLLRKSVHGLQRYLDLKHRLPLAQRAEVVKILYHVITTESELDQSLQQIFANQICRLLKRRGAPLDITLEWRPLQKMLEFQFFGKARISQTPLCPYLGHYLVNLARLARRHFPKGSNAEILAEFRPLMCPLTLSPLLKAQCYLELLLDRTDPDIFSVVEDVISIWDWVSAYVDWELHWMTLVSSVCRQTYREQGAKWQALLPKMYSHVLHVIDLPVGPSRMHIFSNGDNSVTSPEGYPFYSLGSFVNSSSGRSKTLQLIHKSSKLMVYMLKPGGGDSMRLLKQLSTAIEGFLHPSNGGYWTLRLSQLISSLCEYFAERIHRERDSPDGCEYKLKKSDIGEFAQIILPLALQGLYSKNSTAILHSCSALRQLGFLDLPTMLPPLLENTFRALTTLTEVHQTSSALEALAAIIFPMIRPQPDGGEEVASIAHLPDLMELALQGIDANDLTKTWATLRFCTVLLSGLPLIPITGDAPPGVDAARHEQARQVTDTFADWAFRFLDQAFTFIQNLSANPHAEAGSEGGKDTETRTSEYFFHCTLEVLFMQLGDELYEAALGKVATFCFTNFLHPQQQAQLGVVLSAITAVNPQAVCSRILSVCFARLLTSPSENTVRSPKRAGGVASPRRGGGHGGAKSPRERGAGGSARGLLAEDYSLAVLSEQEIVCYLSIICYVAEQAGDTLLPYREEMTAVIDHGLRVEERPGARSVTVHKSITKLIRSLCHSLVTCRPVETRSVPEEVWNDPAWRNTHYTSWGKVMYMKDVNLKWREPSEEGLKWAADLTKRYSTGPITGLRLWLARESALNHENSGEAPEKGPSPKIGTKRKAVGGARGRAKKKAAQSVGAIEEIAKQEGASTMADVKNLVKQLRSVLEGIASVLPGWVNLVDKRKSDENRGKMPGGEEYSNGACELPPASATACRGLPGGGAGGTISRDEIGQLLHDVTAWCLKERSEDTQMLKALGKCVDVCMNGADILQKRARRMRLRYSIMKARNCEPAGGGRDKALPRYVLSNKIFYQYLARLMQRQRKLGTSNLVSSIVEQVHEMSTYAFPGVRTQGQLGLLSCLRRYDGACAFSLPRLVALLQDKDSESPGHDQRVIGATTMLSTGYAQGRIMRDWAMIRQFLLSVSQSGHHEKDEVLDALDSLFNTFLGSWYQVSLSIPEYTKWNYPPGSAAECMGFKGYSELIETLADLVTSNPNMHWSYRLMVFDALSVMIRDDAPTPISVWMLMMDGMVSDISHVREACYPAISCAMELLQRERPSKLASGSPFTRFPDKAYTRWNGASPFLRFDEEALAARHQAFSVEYIEEVKRCVLEHLRQEDFLEGFISALSIIQLGRARSFVGSHAQMFKGMCKTIGPAVIECFAPFLATLKDDDKQQGKVSSDVYMGMQCLAAEMVGGIVRASVRWERDEDIAAARAVVLDALGHMMKQAETESVSIWASCLRFCVYHRHPSKIGWLLTALFDNGLPQHGETNASSVHACKRMMLMRHVIKELGWRGAALQRQLSHDLVPFLTSPLAQTRSCVGSCLAALSRTSWDPRSDIRAGGFGSGKAGGEAKEEGQGTRPGETVHSIVEYITREWAELAPLSSGRKLQTAGEACVEAKAQDSKLKMLRQTVISWMSATCPNYDSLHSCPIQPHLSVLVAQLVQALEESDPDIVSQAQSCAELCSNNSLHPTGVRGDVLKVMETLAESSSWQVRSAVLPFLQVLVFRHQFLIDQAGMSKIQTLMISLLQDPQVEVREMASSSVAVLVRICGSDLALQLMDKFKEWSSESLQAREDGVTGSDRGKSLQRRHSGVLGFSALVAAYPYDLPVWMPGVLVRLAKYVTDPNPIRGTVRKAFGEFWRTHQDAWPMLKKKFTDDQLFSLTNLLASPSYFT